MAPRTDDGPALGSLGIALAVPPVLLLPLLPDGGLAPFAAAAAAAAIVGVATAVAEWRGTGSGPSSGRPAAELDFPGPVRSALDVTAELVGIGLVAVAATSLAHDGVIGIVAAHLVWPVGALLSRRSLTAGLPALLAIVLATAGAVAAVVVAPPWTLLAPRWDAAGVWLGPALVAGVWLAGAATGQFTVGPRREPGQRRAPWALLGAGLLLAVALAVRQGARFEAALGDPGPDPLAQGAVWLGLVSAVAALSRRSAMGRVPRCIGGTLSTSWLVLAGPLATAWVGVALLPMVGAVTLVVRGSRPAGRPALLAGAVLLVFGTLLARPGLPVHPEDAAAVGALVVVGFWLVATRTVLARGAA